MQSILFHGDHISTNVPILNAILILHEFEKLFYKTYKSTDHTQQAFFRENYTYDFLPICYKMNVRNVLNKIFQIHMNHHVHSHNFHIYIFSFLFPLFKCYWSNTFLFTLLKIYYTQICWLQP